MQVQQQSSMMLMMMRQVEARTVHEERMERLRGEEMQLHGELSVLRGKVEQLREEEEGRRLRLETLEQNIRKLQASRSVLLKEKHQGEYELLLAAV